MRWGMPLSEAEAAELAARADYQIEVMQNVSHFLRTMPTFAGAYFDIADKGRLVVLLSERTEATEDSIRARMPSDGPDVAIREGQYTYGSLEDATSNVYEVWGQLTDLPAPYGVRLNVMANAVTIGVDKLHVDAVTALTPKLVAALGVSVTVEATTPPVANDCSSRENCDYPLRSAVIIRKGSGTGSPCTLAFQVRRPATSDEQWLTAAHCALSGSNSWYHQGFGLLGTEQQTLWSTGFDAIRIQMPDTQASNQMYADGPVRGWAWPFMGMGLWQNQGFSGNDPTYVTDDYACWSYSGQTLCGALMYGVGGVGGDSGSPLYASDSAGGVYAVGINFGGAFGGGAMTRIGDVLSRLGVVLVTS